MGLRPMPLFLRPTASPTGSRIPIGDWCHVCSVFQSVVGDKKVLLFTAKPTKPVPMSPKALNPDSASPIMVRISPPWTMSTSLPLTGMLKAGAPGLIVHTCATAYVERLIE
jgi:hypothetical protein